MDVNDLIRDDPKLDRDAQGKPVSWGVPGDLLRFLDERVTSETNTLETGAGLSTIFFALKEAQHTCIVPDAVLVERIKEYCQARHVSTHNIRFCSGRSEEILPTLEIRNLDLVLIDGQHGFPVPFIDWFYTARHLGVGGLVVVDDTQIWTGAVLRDFLLREPGWELVGDFAGKCVVFRKLREFPENQVWFWQPFVVERSRQSRISQMFLRIRTALRLAAQGEFLLLFKKGIGGESRK